MRRFEPLGEHSASSAATGFACRESSLLVPYVQSCLPYVRLGARQISAGDAQTTPFAHPFERAFAELLSFYGVQWCYEPTSFALTWSDDGLPREMFTPDFYLPEHRVYIELTAMRQRLVTRKHRKIRRLRELYPQVDVKLLYRRDYERIARSFGRRRGAGSPARVTLRDQAEIHVRLRDLGRAIAGDHHPDDPPLAIAVGDGGVGLLESIVGAAPECAALLERTGCKVEVAKFQVGDGTRRVRVTNRPRCAVAGRRVVLFVDIVSTGLTLSYVVRWLRRRGATSVDVCTLLDRESARIVQIPIKYVGFPAPSEIVVGFGLSLYREFKGLDHLAMLLPAPAGVTPPADRDRLP
jgi:hypoxanthine phosphoribosyltransferase